jgi:hypothetical protein
VLLILSKCFLQYRCAFGFVSTSRALSGGSNKPQHQQFDSKLQAIAPTSISDVLFAGLHSSSVVPALLYKKTTADAAQGTFWFCLSAGSGAGGIGLRQIPKLYEEVVELKELAESGTSSGGDTFQGPVASLWYPEALSVADIQKVLKAAPEKATVITEKSTSKAYVATMGYMERNDFINCVGRKKCNPLASYAAFDALSGGKGNFASPVDYEANLKKWKSTGGVELLGKALENAILVKLSSFVALAFLLFIIFDLIIENYIYGWM